MPEPAPSVHLFRHQLGKTPDATTQPPTSLVADAHKGGLFVHAYTFRGENRYLALDYNHDPVPEYLKFYRLGIDGVFSDYANRAWGARKAYLEEMGRQGRQPALDAGQIMSRTRHTVVSVQTRREEAMDTHLVLVTSLTLMTVTAVGGVGMAIMRFAGRPHPPAWLAMLHGLLAGAALTLLLYFAVVVGLPALANIAILLFALAALMGIYLNLRFHMNDLALPKPLMLLHAAIAVAGYLCLLAATVQTA